MAKVKVVDIYSDIIGHGNGKMSSIDNISTSCRVNRCCQARIAAAIKEICTVDPDGWFLYSLPAKDKRHITKYRLVARLKARGMEKPPICAFCFADSLLEYRQNVGTKCAENSNRFEKIVAIDDLPVIRNSQIFRFESFGDVANWEHAFNYLQICVKNPDTVFTAWTKNPAFYLKALTVLGYKPENFRLILSSYRLNVRDTETFFRFNDLSEKAIGIRIFDDLFTVWSDVETARAAGVEITCCTHDINGNVIPAVRQPHGARCIGCMRCYGKRHSDTIFIDSILHD